MFHRALFIWVCMRGGEYAVTQLGSTNGHRFEDRSAQMKLNKCKVQYAPVYLRGKCARMMEDMVLGHAEIWRQTKIESRGKKLNSWVLTNRMLQVHMNLNNNVEELQPTIDTLISAKEEMESVDSDKYSIDTRRVVGAIRNALT